jgi:hypothetical protein
MASAPILASAIRGGVLTRAQVQKMADHYIKHGMVPGDGPIKMSDELAAALMRAGWTQTAVEKFAETILCGAIPNK